MATSLRRPAATARRGFAKCKAKRVVIARRRHCHGNGVRGAGPVGYTAGMDQLSYRRHRFPPPIIQHAIWLYLPFTLSHRDVEELLAERGLEASFETVRRWV